MDKIEKKYTDVSNPGSFSGLSGFLKNNKELNSIETKNKLSSINSYTLHKPLIKKFKRSQTIVSGIDDTWQIDLVDVSNLKNKKLSQFFSFLFVCIDVFSKYAFVIPIANKSANESTRAFKLILKNGRSPTNIYSDNGKEFMGSFKSLLKELNINQLFTKSIFKASVVERFNRTLKQKMYRVFSFQKNKNYINILHDLVESYNKSYHTAIKMSPIQVNKKNEKRVFNNLYGKNLNDAYIQFKFKIGDYVRKQVVKLIFEKGYTPNWSEEIFIISMLIPSVPPKYNLKTLDNEKLPDYYYREELQNVKFPYDSFEVIEKKGDQILLKKLNSNIEKSVWVYKNFFSDDKQSEISNSEFSKEYSQKENTKRTTRSTTKKTIK